MNSFKVLTNKDLWSMFKEYTKPILCYKQQIKWDQHRHNGNYVSFLFYSPSLKSHCVLFLLYDNKDICVYINLNYICEKLTLKETFCYDPCMMNAHSDCNFILLNNICITCFFPFLRNPYNGSFQDMQHQINELNKYIGYVQSLGKVYYTSIYELKSQVSLMNEFYQKEIFSDIIYKKIKNMIRDAEQFMYNELESCYHLNMNAKHFSITNHFKIKPYEKYASKHIPPMDFGI